MLFLGLPIFIIVVLISILIYNRNTAPDRVKFATEEVNNYLKQEYNEDFKLKLVYKGFASKYHKFVGIDFKYGKDKNKLLYVFEYSPLDFPDISYKINLIVGKNDTNVVIRENFDNYSKYKIYFDEKRQIKDDLEKIISNNYSKYSINYCFSYNTIDVNINDVFYSEINKNTIQEVIKLVENKKIIVSISFNDVYNIETNETTLEEINEILQMYNDLYNYLFNNYNEKYELRTIGSLKIFQVTFYFDIINNYDDQQEMVFKKLCDLSTKYKKNIELRYYEDIYSSNYFDCAIKPNNTKSLKELIDEKKY